MRVLLIMNATQEKIYTVIIEQDEDGIYIAKVPDILGCYTQGKTVRESPPTHKAAGSRGRARSNP